MTESAPLAPQHVSALHGVILAFVPVMVVLTVVAPIPVIPAIVAAFPEVNEAGFAVSLAVTAPILAIAVAGILLGVLGERVSRRRLLTFGAAVYAPLALLPLWIDSLPLLIGSRFLAGLALGAMMVAAVGLVGDYFTGARRAFWLAAQGSFPAAATILGSIASGVLGQEGWRAPFLILLTGVPLFLAILLVRPPAVPVHSGTEAESAESQGASLASWVIAGIFLVAIVASLLMFAPAYEFGYLLQDRNLASPFLIGTMTAVLGAGAAVGAFAIPMLRRVPPQGQMALCFIASCVGQIVLAWSNGVTGLLAGAAIAGLGQGGAVPALSMWLLDRASAASRSRAVSLFQTTLYVAQFSSPHLARFTSLSLGSSAKGMMLYAVILVALALALGAAATLKQRRLAPA